MGSGGGEDADEVDVNLAKRRKSRCIAYQDFELDYGGKISYLEGKSNEDVKKMLETNYIEIDDDDEFDSESSSKATKQRDVEVIVIDSSEKIKISSRNDRDWFRERVIEILKKPYDQKEYDELLEEVGHRRPVIEDRVLRNGRAASCSVPIGKSYLDQCQDLDMKIKSAGSDKLKILNLLRGFFFWLQWHFLIHLVDAYLIQCAPHEGAFKPWKDSSCLEVLPQGNVASDSHDIS
ncbi:uncharacterized protein LOC110607037 isoform X2 [Manihot esculenta]|uniref:uncharacterized protein LOC110607037 isoform X2 n=1 Tax=Manihot esculenta TaxID=3983 RepID=UPI001CC54C4C|nr:uncharacterized protein LOC110607037 isoform X2 [Manihot esculenta]